MTPSRRLLSGASVAAAAGFVGAAASVVLAIVQLVDSADYEGGLDASPSTNRTRAAILLVVAIVAALASRALLAWRARHRPDDEERGA